ncbi:MAG: HAD family hydrolase [Candidatus Thiodiazotropha sp.]
MLETKQALLLDMNSTFMFGEDRFSDDEDYSEYYSSLGGKLPKNVVNGVIKDAFEYLEVRYPDVKYRHSFPSVEEAIVKAAGLNLPNEEIGLMASTFSFHEHGYIPDDYIKTLSRLASKFTLSAVIDIWSAKDRWLNTFKEKGIISLFSAMSFSSDHGMIKPSSIPFELVVNELGIAKEHCVVVGDSVRRDLGGAMASGIDCVLVGGACDEKALACYANLLKFEEDIR